MKQIVSVGCDGMLGVFDLRKAQMYAMSDNFEEDLPMASSMFSLGTGSEIAMTG